MKNYLLLLALATVCAVSSCSKDDDEAEPAPATPSPAALTINNPLSGLNQGSTDPAVIQFTKEILTGTTWKLTNLVKGIDNTLNFRDVYKDIPSCQRDNSYTFNAAATTLTVADGLDWCGANEQTINGSWAMPNSAKLTISASGITQGGLTGDFTIVQISEETLVLQQKANGFTYVATYGKYVAPPAELVMLVNKNWQLTADQEFYNGSTFDNYAYLPNCLKDNFTRFGANSYATNDEGATKCSSSDPQTTTTWYGLQGTTLYIDGQQYTITQNTATTLKLSQSNYYQGYYSSRQKTYTKI